MSTILNVNELLIMKKNVFRMLILGGKKGHVTSKLWSVLYEGKKEHCVYAFH